MVRDAGSTNVSAGKGGGVSIASTGSAPIVVNAAGATATLKTGDAIQASRKGIDITAGTVTVARADGSVSQLSAGESTAPPVVKTAAAAPVAESETPAPAPAPAPAPSPKQEVSCISPSSPDCN